MCAERMLDSGGPGPLSKTTVNAAVSWKQGQRLRCGPGDRGWARRVLGTGV